MCGRYSLTGPNPARARFPALEAVAVRRRFNVAPTDPVAAVTTDRDGVPLGAELRWGLVPHWAKDARAGAKMINARAETVAEKPAFRDAFARRRCLIVADGFYEWQRADGARRAHWIHRADGAPFAFAGLWATWHGSGDATLRTCSIITTHAAAATDAIHPRMPVMLPAEAEAAWLDPATPAAALQELLVPWPEDVIAVRRVSSAVNDVRHDGPECLEAPHHEDDREAPAGATSSPEAPTLF